MQINKLEQHFKWGPCDNLAKRKPTTGDWVVITFI